MAGENYFDLATEKEFGSRLQLANSIAEQIWREQQLVSTRMQWNFTFQAFLAAIYVFAGSNLKNFEQLSVQIALAVVGFTVSLFCFWGIIAAQSQSTRLKKHWANEFCRSPPDDPGLCQITRGAFPQPFSDTQNSRRGRYASRGVCIALMIMWFALAAIASVSSLLNRSGGPGELVCTLDTPSLRSGALTMSCKAR